MQTSEQWEIRYRPTLPRSVWEAARNEAAGSGAGPEEFPLNEGATKPRLIGDALQFTSVRGRPREVPIDALRSIVVKVEHGRGALEGAGLGFLTGAGLGALIGFTSGNDPPLPSNSDCGPCSFTAREKAAFGAVVGGVIGLGAGLLVGAIVGHRDVIEFAEPGGVRVLPGGGGTMHE